MSSFKKSIFVFLLLLFTGCATTPSVDKRISIIDSYHNRGIVIKSVTSTINSGNLMEIQVIGVNKTESYKQLEYKIDWFDHNGHQIRSAMSIWTKFPAYQNTEFMFKAVAPKETANDYKILIRKEGN